MGKMTEIERKANKKSLSYDTKYSEDRTLKDMLSRPQAFVEGAIEGIVNLLRQKAYRDGYIAGAEENGVVWHDLRKNPEDLPDKGRVAFSHVVMTNEGFREYCNTFTGEWFVAGTFELVDKPRAWCEIPRFEEK